MYKLMMYIRKIHPLFHLRKFKVFQQLTKVTDIPILIRIYNIKFPIYGSLSKNLSFILTGGLSGEAEEKKNFQFIIQQLKILSFFDVGANIGVYGFHFKSEVPDGKVLMFEPDLGNAKLIRRTIEKHQIKNAILVSAAVSDQCGVTNFHIDDISGATGSIIETNVSKSFIEIHHNVTPKVTTVDMVTLDSIADSYWEPDLIKIDVEGAELNVLNGSKKIIKKVNPAIIFESDPNNESVKTFMSENDYQLFDLVTLKMISQLVHNNLALHNVKHKKLINEIINHSAN